MPDIMVLLAHGEENQPTVDYGMPVSTDMVYSNTPAIKCGETAAQVFIGTKSLITNIEGMKTDKQFINALKEVMPVVDPNDLVSCTFLMPPQEDGQQCRAHIVQAIKDQHSKDLDNDGEITNKLLSIIAIDDPCFDKCNHDGKHKSIMVADGYPTDVLSVYSGLILLQGDISLHCPSMLVFFVQQYQRQLPAPLHLAHLLVVKKGLLAFL
jgi:hypothetical protein